MRPRIRAGRAQRGRTPRWASTPPSAASTARRSSSSRPRPLQGSAPASDPTCTETLARCYLATGASTKGIALLERCLAASATDPILQTRYRSQLARALHAGGDTQRARALVEQAAALANEFAAPRLRVFHYRALARAAWAKRAPEPALAHAWRALALLEALDDTSQLAHSHRLCGELCGLEHQWEQALRHLNRAERLLEQTGDSEQLGTVRAEQAKALAGLGHSDQSLARASEAAELLTATGASPPPPSTRSRSPKPPRATSTAPTNPSSRHPGLRTGPALAAGGGSRLRLGQPPPTSPPARASPGRLQPCGALHSPRMVRQIRPGAAGIVPRRRLSGRCRA